MKIELLPCQIARMESEMIMKCSRKDQRAMMLANIYDFLSLNQPPKLMATMTAARIKNGKGMRVVSKLVGSTSSSQAPVSVFWT